MKRSLGAKSVVYPAPVFVIGTYDREGRANAATVAWGGICCSQPPCINISLRKATYTYANIMEHRAFTVNIPSERYVKEVDYLGIYSGKNIDKFSETGLTPKRGTMVDAPYIEEFPFVLECSLAQTIELGLHTLFIGEIRDIKADESFITEENIIDVEKVRPIIYAPEIRMYFGIGRFLGRSFSMGKKQP
ncbi:MAG TPA: flavin reductase family protein [Syntrophorhabdaceae bacterium]|nr:flavin reductase family protein [Syntrophorhabdaceae bacterium]HOL05998.1 flavin reductase family protein [Syntrophorhabdaceae bacterium]HOT42275.1 flavin reductase family protein [Syntrophorhabdaceae bacterium]HPC66986.1 flavin reductase family protein [Syntrophorhabdaceae bacterium]HPP42413.1 flavin reductase family protein [Syntrophorhabdaceae bacterium]